MWTKSTSYSNLAPQKRAKDILNSQNICDKVASFRIANVRVGQTLTSLGISSNTTHSIAEKKSNDKEFIPAFIKTEVISTGVSLIIVGNHQSIRVWRIIFIEKSKCVSELVFTKNQELKNGHGNFIDASISRFLDNEGLYGRALLLLSDYHSSSPSAHYCERQTNISQIEYNVKIALINRENKVSVDKSITRASQYHAVVTSISSTKHVIVVALTTSAIHLLDTITLKLLSEVSSVVSAPVVYAVSERWIAIQDLIIKETFTSSVETHRPLGSLYTLCCLRLVLRGSSSSDKDSDISESETGGPTSGDTARLVVSGLYGIGYGLGKLGWNTVTPVLRNLVSNTNKSGCNDSSSMNDSETAQTETDRQTASSFATTQAGPSVINNGLGGGIIIWDTGQLEYASTDRDGGVEVHPKALLRFRPYREDVSVMAFSPSGLRLASAGSSGQVILVHALCTPGMLPSSPHLFTSIDRVGTHHTGAYAVQQVLHRPHLLYKLVRGLTLARVVDIKFDSLETTAFVATSSGTVHVFDLDVTGASSNQSQSQLQSQAQQQNKPSQASQAFTQTRSVRTTMINMNHSPSSSSPLSGTPLSTGSSPSILDKTYQQSSSCSPSSWSAPTTDVAQLLQMHPSLVNRQTRGRQIYADVRIRLPLRPLTMVGGASNSSSGFSSAVSVGGTNSKTGNGGTAQSNGSYPISATTTSSAYLNVQLVVSHGGDSEVNQAIRRTFSQPEFDMELLAVTSEGLLSRIRLSNSTSQVVNSIANTSPMQLVYRELNRWDLAAEPGLVDSESSDLSSLESSALSIRRMRGSGQCQDYNVLGRESREYSRNARHCSWLASVADFVEYPELPLYLRPQATLKMTSAVSPQIGKGHHGFRTASSVCDFLFPERVGNTLVKVRRPGPYVPGPIPMSGPQTRGTEGSGVTRRTMSVLQSQVASAIQTELFLPSNASGYSLRERGSAHESERQRCRDQDAEMGSRVAISSPSKATGWEDSWAMDMDMDWSVPVYDDLGDEVQLVGESELEATSGTLSSPHTFTHPPPHPLTVKTPMTSAPIPTLMTHMDTFDLITDTYDMTDQTQNASSPYEEVKLSDDYNSAVDMTSTSRNPQVEAEQLVQMKPPPISSNLVIKKKSSNSKKKGK